MRLWRWLAQLAGYLASPWRRPEGGRRTVEHPQIDQTARPPEPVPAEEAMSPEQQRRLDRVRAIYHVGSQPLTVARARYDLIRRGAFDAHQ